MFENKQLFVEYTKFRYFCRKLRTENSMRVNGMEGLSSQEGHVKVERYTNETLVIDNPWKICKCGILSAAISLCPFPCTQDG